MSWPLDAPLYPSIHRFWRALKFEAVSLRHRTGENSQERAPEKA